MLLNEEYLRKVVRESIHKILTEDEQQEWFLNYGFDENFDFAKDIMNNCHLWEVNEDEDGIYLMFEPNDENLGYYYVIYVDCNLDWYSDGSEGGYDIERANPYITNIKSVRIDDNNTVGSEEIEIKVNESDEFIEFLENELMENFYSEEDLVNYTEQENPWDEYDPTEEYNRSLD